jgi:hypothetical protein
MTIFSFLYSLISLFQFSLALYKAVFSLIVRGFAIFLPVIKTLYAGAITKRLTLAADRKRLIHTISLGLEKKDLSHKKATEHPSETLTSSNMPEYDKNPLRSPKSVIGSHEDIDRDFSSLTACYDRAPDRKCGSSENALLLPRKIPHASSELDLCDPCSTPLEHDNIADTGYEEDRKNLGLPKTTMYFSGDCQDRKLFSPLVHSVNVLYMNDVSQEEGVLLPRKNAHCRSDLYITNPSNSPLLAPYF